MKFWRRLASCSTNTQVNAPIAFERTGLDRRPESAAGAVAAAVAIPVTDPKAALLAVLARCRKASATDIERAWSVDRSIVWLSGMRASKVLVSADLAPAFMGAFRETAIDSTRSELRSLGADLRAIDAAELRVLDCLRSSDGPLARAAIAARTGLDPRIADGAVWCLAAAGILLRAGRAGGWRSTLHQVDLTERWLTGIQVPDPTRARSLVAAAYLASYGPATDQDLAWWSGFTKPQARAALSGAGAVERQGRFDVPSPQKTVRWPAREVRLLPAGDPLSMAFKNPERLVPRARVAAIYRDRRWPEPLVIALGRAVGTWSLTDGPKLWGERRLSGAASREWQRLRQGSGSSEAHRAG